MAHLLQDASFIVRPAINGMPGYVSLEAEGFPVSRAV